VLGVAGTIDSPLLNDRRSMSVSFPVRDGESFVVFASDYLSSEFVAGRTLTLTAYFSDGASATAVVRAP
jgi:hypothetical protein